MTVEILRGKTDPILDEIASVLGKSFQRDHSKAKIAIYRQNPASVRIRIIDPIFTKMSRAERNDYGWTYLDRLSDDAQADISLLLLLTPSEVKKDFANIEFENPVPSITP
jgi:hypothetical protein